MRLLLQALSKRPDRRFLLPRSSRSDQVSLHPEPRSCVWRADKGGVTTLCLLPNGQLASGSDDSTIRLWDVTTGTETACLEGHEGSIQALCLLANGRLIASRSDDRTIRLWDFATSIQVKCLPLYVYSGRSLCALRDGRLAWDSWDGTIFLGDTEAEAQRELRGGHGDAWVLSVLSDGRLAVGSA